MDSQSLPDTAAIPTNVPVGTEQPPQTNLAQEVEWNPEGHPDQVSATLRDSKISIAVDVSGSTYGSTLATEKRAIQSVCSLIPRSKHSNITIVPWNDHSGRPFSMNEIEALESDGGTDPNVLLEAPTTRRVLQESAFWFLMTDGIIEEYIVRRFARNITHYGMHGKACIISVFGERLQKPSDCNISVGLSVFAVSPHVAFLYTDVEFNRTYIMSTKGCFSTLLPSGKGNPRLDYNTTWEDLPQVSYENLTRVSVPPAQNLERDEVALQDDSRVNIKDLLSHDTVDEKVMRQIMLNEDNMRTIAITAKLRGESDKLSRWLDKVDEKLDQTDQETCDREQTSQLLRDFESSFNTEGNAQTPNLYVPRTTNIWATVTPSEDMSPLVPTARPPRTSSYIMRSISLSSVDMPDDNFLSFDQEEDSGLNLANAGFLRPNQRKDYFSGSCPKCGRSGEVLAIFLTAPVTANITENIPLPGSLSKLTYPLTMGNYAETDIISNTLVCDSCAAEIARCGVTPRNETIAGVLPLVSYNKNQLSWVQTLHQATEQRFDRLDLPLVFLAILFTKLERLLSVEETTHPSLRDALEWECNMILSQVVIQGTSASGISHFGTGAVDELLLQHFRDAMNPKKASLLLRYPMDGFIVANAAVSNSKYNPVLNKEKRKSIVLLRLLYHLVENYRAYGKENGEVQLHAAKTLLLLLDDPSGPRSLFRWKSVRQFSVIFKSVEDLRKHLRENANLGSYKLSVTISDLLGTPLLSEVNLADFRRLGVLFSWIESQTGHAIAVFVHHLMRFETEECSSEKLFQKLRDLPEVREALADPGALSARNVESLIKGLPLLE
ncbi:hypothetical protein G7Z17_g2637 [Cylindrodendrum hubeiense]|uniref:Uncharacterized protein n=1 Tax=Cylindrodendrum hubeiense TaxID=595255 RepID=A0A9P5HKC0_9HYPO|nr:hypothetical protein G7Z17_g2637 [Cylindrodendrum hubeiense]